MDVELLISEIFTRKALWQKNNPHHHNRFVLDKLWDDVAVVLGTTREAVRTKWKNLKDNYRKELKKIVKRNAEDNTTYKPFWPYFDLLYFLKDQILAGSRINILKSESPSNTTDFSDDGDSKDVFQIEEHVALITQNGTNARKRILNDEVKEKNIRVEKKFKDNGAEGEVKSDDYHFFMSLIPFVTNLSPVQKLNVRNKIQQIILDEVLAISKDNTIILRDISIPDK